jgi:GAF domain-containing protein
VQPVLGQAGQPQVEEVVVEPNRKLLTEPDVLRILKKYPSQLQRTRDLIIIRDRQHQAIDAETASVLGLHAPDVFGVEWWVVSELGVVKVGDAAQPERPLEQPLERSHVAELDDPVQARQVLPRV